MHSRSLRGHIGAPVLGEDFVWALVPLRDDRGIVQKNPPKDFYSFFYRTENLWGMNYDPLLFLLVYIIDDSIIIRALPTLIRQSSIDEVKNVCAICPSEDMRLIYAINKSGSCIKVIKDQI